MMTMIDMHHDDNLDDGRTSMMVTHTTMMGKPTTIVKTTRDIPEIVLGYHHTLLRDC